MFGFIGGKKIITIHDMWWQFRCFIIFEVGFWKICVSLCFFLLLVRCIGKRSNATRKQNPTKEEWKQMNTKASNPYWMVRTTDNENNNQSKCTGLIQTNIYTDINIIAYRTFHRTTIGFRRAYVDSVLSTCTVKRCSTLSRSFHFCL